MKIIIPMAGWGTRMRPHTLTVPKPLIPIAGKPMVQWIVEGLVKSTDEKVDDIAFIIREDFGKETEATLVQIAEKLGSKGHICYQDKPLGTAHAILCAGNFLEGNIIVAFADTLFKSNFKLDSQKDGIIFVQKVEDPKPFGVVVLNESGVIEKMVEKPQDFVSDLAIIGIYYFKEGAILKSEMQYLLDNGISTKGEYQLTDALDNMRNKGASFVTGQVEEWLDCGNKNATVYTQQRILEIYKKDFENGNASFSENSIIIPPCFIGEGVQIKNSVIGPHVSLGKNTIIDNCIIKNSMIQAQSVLKNRLIHNTMIGNNVKLVGNFEDLSVGDFTTQES